MDFNTELDVRECDDAREELQPYVLSQYSGSPTITQLLSDFRDNIDPQVDIETFKENIMDIDTASGVGLDTWGRIVGLPRQVYYNETTVTLDDETYRRLLMFKAMSNITDTSLATLNRMLPILFGNNALSARNIIVKAQSGDEYYNTYPMHVMFTTSRPFSTMEKLLFNLGVTMNLAAGVGWSLIVYQDGVFGFKGSGLKPFNCGVFTSSDNIAEGGY